MLTLAEQILIFRLGLKRANQYFVILHYLSNGMTLLFISDYALNPDFSQALCIKILNLPLPSKQLPIL
jgi:hypothetical protein